MAKVFRCSDVGVSCSWEAIAETEEELLDKVFQHIMNEHKSCKITGAHGISSPLVWRKGTH